MTTKLGLVFIGVVLSAPFLLRAETEPPAKSAPSTDAVLLTINGAGDTALKFTDAALKKLPRQTERVKEKNGQAVAFQGVLVRDLLKESGVKFGDRSTRGELLLTYLLIEAADGYKVLFALADFDTELTDKTYLIADSADDKALDAKDGPLRLIIPDEKMHARWIRQVTSLKIVRIPDSQKPPDEKKH